MSKNAACWAADETAREPRLYVQLQLVLALPAACSWYRVVLRSQFFLGLRPSVCVSLVFDPQHRSCLLGTLHVLFVLSPCVPTVVKLCSLENSPLGLGHWLRDEHSSKHVQKSMGLPPVQICAWH